MNKTNKISLFNKPVIVLAAISLLLNAIFLYYNQWSCYFPLNSLHGEIGFNFYHFNSFKRNSKISKYLSTLPKEKPSTYNLNDPYYAADQPWEYPQEVNPVYDTVGYGMLMGIIWKITHSLRYFDIQILQIIIFTLLMWFIYSLALMLFGNPFIAFIIGITHLFFFPLIWLNVQVMRDIWAYYGSLMLAWTIVYCLQSAMRWRWAMLTASFFGICQIIRPIGVPAMITMSLVILGYGFYHRSHLKQCFKTLLLITSALILFFWAPFILHNQYAYNRWLAGPIGQILMEGWGEFENPANYQISDLWFQTYISSKYCVPFEDYGKPYFDDLAKQEVLETIKNNKCAYCCSMIRRIPQILMPHFPWFDDPASSPFEACNSLWEKVTKVFSSFSTFIYFLTYRRYVLLFLFFGYLGMYLAWTRKLYFQLALLLIGSVSSGWGMIISHFEPRYLVSFYWPVAFFVGIAVEFLWKRIRHYITWKQSPHTAPQAAT